MTSESKNVYIDKLDDMIDEYNNTYHRPIKMKPVDIKDNIYFDFQKEVNDKDPKFKVGDHIIISRYKNIFAKGYTPKWCEEVFVTKRVKIQFYGHMLLMVSMGIKLLKHFMKKNYRKLIKKISKQKK